MLLAAGLEGINATYLFICHFHPSQTDNRGVSHMYVTHFQRDISCNFFLFAPHPKMTSVQLRIVRITRKFAKLENRLLTTISLTTFSLLPRILVKRKKTRFSCLPCAILNFPLDLRLTNSLSHSFDSSVQSWGCCGWNFLSASISPISQISGLDISSNLLDQRTYECTDGRIVNKYVCSSNQSFEHGWFHCRALSPSRIQRTRQLSSVT